MEDFYGHLSNRTLSLIGCILWIFSHTDGSIISRVVGSRVILNGNVSKSELRQLTWKKDGALLISYNTEQSLFFSKAANSLKINISLSEKNLYALVIHDAQKFHTGNYTCDIIMATGVWEEKWELVINGEHMESGYQNNILIPVATAVTCVCFLIFTLSFILVQRIYNQHSQQSSQPPNIEMWQEETAEDIYENCLEINVSYTRSYHYKSTGQ